MIVDTESDVYTETVMNQWMKALLGFSKVHSTAEGMSLRLDTMYSRAEIENLRQQTERYYRLRLKRNVPPKRLPSDWIRDVWTRGDDKYLISRTCGYLLEKYGMKS